MPNKGHAKEASVQCISLVNPMKIFPFSLKIQKKEKKQKKEKIKHHKKSQIGSD